ncbi:ceramide synthase 4-like isoform X2 [Notamacropus eugenii]|uniref:ceramide synthase 4-like isoform X2 n=1 Tax=Notamacropus eugenii TaxID=9315 RepID=UPI003B670922
MLDTLYKSFWNAEYWIPTGYTWTDLEDSDDIIYPHPKDLLATIPMTFVLIVIRYFTERAIGLPLSRALGVRDPIRIKATPNPILESFFRTQRKNPEKYELNHLASQCGLSMRQTECWFRRRRNQERPLISKKFSESCWRFLFYSCTFFGGLLIFCNKTWFGQPETVWDEYPKQPLQPVIYWWYLLELSFYISLLLTLTLDVKRKAYKMLSYAQWKLAREATFIIFTLVFLSTRLILFPNKVLYTTYYVVRSKDKFFFGYYFAITLLMVLQCLNVFWSFLILRMFYKFLSEGQAKNDVRSDIEELDMSD